MESSKTSINRNWYKGLKWMWDDYEDFGEGYAILDSNNEVLVFFEQDEVEYISSDEFIIGKGKYSKKVSDFLNIS